jgi:hypothetical protein
MVTQPRNAPRDVADDPWLAAEIVGAKRAWDSSPVQGEPWRDQGGSGGYRSNLRPVPSLNMPEPAASPPREAEVAQDDVLAKSVHRRTQTQLAVALLAGTAVGLMTCMVVAAIPT